MVQLEKKKRLTANSKRFVLILNRWDLSELNIEVAYTSVRTDDYLRLWQRSPLGPLRLSVSELLFVDKVSRLCPHLLLQQQDTVTSVPIWMENFHGCDSDVEFPLSPTFRKLNPSQWLCGYSLQCKQTNKKSYEQALNKMCVVCLTWLLQEFIGQ